MANRQASYIKKNFSMEDMEKQLIGYLDEYASNIPTEIMLKLPTLTPTVEDIKKVKERIKKLPSEDRKVIEDFANDVADKIKLPQLKKIEE